MCKNISCLVVDADEMTRHRHSGMLAGECFRVRSVCNGVDALLEMEKVAYDLVLLNLPNPGLDALAWLCAIKQRWPDCEVVIVTDHPSIETATVAIRLGAYDYLPKPVRPERLLQAAQEAVAHKQWALRCERIAA
ncbi:MAG: response regulator [Rhodocyclaceae bacterium]|nr:MAG: response regulator [Rhodocyclaceae bacterium]